MLVLNHTLRIHCMGRPDVSAETTPPLTPAIPLHPGAWLRQKPGVGAELVFSPSSVRAHPLSFQRWRKGVHAEALCTGRGQHGLAFPPSVGPALCIASTSIKTALDLLAGSPPLSSAWLEARIGIWFPGTRVTHIRGCCKLGRRPRLLSFS